MFDEHMQDAETTLRLCLEGAREAAWDAHSRHIEKNARSRFGEPRTTKS